MIVVDIPGKSIEVVLAGAVSATQLPFVVNYTNTSREGRKSIGSTNGTTNNTTAVTILAAPSSGARREAESISLYNADTGSATVTIRINDNSTTRIIVKVVLATLDHLIYTAAAGWFVMTSAGFIKSTLTATNLDDLGDVAITSPATSSILIYDGTNFIDSTATYLNTLTANRVLYASATNVLGTAAGLTFDGTTLTAHTATVSTGSLTVTGGTVTTGATTALSLATTAGTVMTLLNAGSVGIGHATPEDFGEVVTAPHLVVGKSTATDPGLTLYGSTTSLPILAFADGTTGNQQYRGYVQYDHTNDITNISGFTNVQLMVQGTPFLRGTAGLVTKLAGTAARATTEGTNHLDIFDGTAPVGTLANGISLYSTAGELRVMDASGTATLLSPHDDDGLWVYDSSCPITGKHLKVDMEKLIKAVNKHFGWNFVHEKVL